MRISDSELSALHNLAAKDAGAAVDFINIADAQALTLLGLARRTPAGWQITSTGAALVKTSHGAPKS